MAPPREQEGSGPEDSVVARDDHLEGTFTSRGTVVVYGSLTGRIEAVRLRIEAGAKVEADVIVDEAIVAGEFSGNLTCRERLEAHASGRINGHVETYKLMLHEGASVEGEMHMLSEAPRDASTTIRGSAPLRGEPGGESRSEPARPAGSQSPVPAGTSTATPPPAPQSSVPTTTRPAPVVTPSSAVKPSPAGAAPSGPASSAPVVAPPGAPVVAPPGAPSAPYVKTGAAPAGPEAAAQRQRSAIVETLRLETMRVAPRATTSSVRQSSPPQAPTGSATANGTRGKGTTPTGF
jgi:cytoskeletal protein CcmA (bactofilin family)